MDISDKISIHAPHEGERRVRGGSTAPKENFNPRSPRGGATFGRDLRYIHVKISIHAPHEGERHRKCCMQDLQVDFNPRSPRGGATVSA